jgi:formylglycine-generating enzyme
MYSKRSADAEKGTIREAVWAFGSKSGRLAEALASFVTLAMVCGCQGGCNRAPDEPVPVSTAAGSQAGPPPIRLTLPLASGTAGAGSVVDFEGQGHGAPRMHGATGGVCPADMVLVSGAFCVDRYEVSLVDQALGRPLSPHYPPDQVSVLRLFETWQRDAPRSRMSLGRSLPVPFPPEFELKESFVPRAVSEVDVLPAGYLSRTSAERACQGAGKRLCSRGEWVTACRGQEGRAFPYGDDYRADACNVHRQTHPARLLHGNSSEYHTDPRLGLTEDQEGPLLRRTGQTKACVSRWGADGLYDMVGNLDEWIDDPDGTFVGGFYSRATKDGCNSMIDVHAPAYFDYSLGTRCCRDPG